MALSCCLLVAVATEASAESPVSWTAKVFSVVVGQSNEQGAGETPSASEPPAPPMSDPVPPHGGRRSWWPRMATLLARKGISFRVANTAVGATSLARSWVGTPVAWRSGDLATKGSLALYAGHVWKATTAPPPYGIGASTQAPDSLPRSDGFTWTDLGAIPAGYYSGHVLKEGELGFDPNGYIAKAFAGFAAAQLDESKVAVVSIGQGDKKFRVRRLQYREALASVADYFARRNVTVFVGFTSPAASEGAKEWYARELQPARRDFLSERKQDRMIVEGADLDRLFGGELPITPATGPGLQADYVHMNDTAYDMAAEAWADVMSRWALNRN